jgi:hypothetical protein
MTTVRDRRQARATGLVPALGFALAVLLGACAGSGAGTAGPGGAATQAAGGGAASTPQGPGGGAESTPQPPGGGANPGGEVSTEGVCGLLTPDDIEQATGYRPIRATSTTAPGNLPDGCEWDLDNPGETPAAIVVGLTSTNGRTLYEEFVSSPVQAGEPLEGIGDLAQQTEPAVVDAVKGETWISVTYMEFPERPDVPQELARLILKKV